MEVIRSINNAKRLKILDAACGRSQICQVLNYYGHDAIGIDINNYFSADKSIKFIQSDLNTSFPFTNNSFDIVINSTALHYLKSSEHFFKETKRVLKHGGKIIFSRPNISSLANRYNFIKTGKIIEFSSALLERKNFPYPDYIFELLQYLGFSVESIMGNYPVFSTKMKLFDMVFGKFIFNTSDPIIKFSNSLIISAKINQRN